MSELKDEDEDKDCCICLEKLEKLEKTKEMDNTLINNLSFNDNILENDCNNKKKDSFFRNKKNKKKEKNKDIENNNVITLNCNHKFHLNCINQIKSNSCPLCRKPIITKKLCPQNHNKFFYVSNFNKKGICRICLGYSLEYCLKNNIY